MYKKIFVIAISFSAMLWSCDSDSQGEKKTEKDKKAVVDITIADSTVIKEGKKIAMGTFKILNSKLKSAIDIGGPISGIEVCSSEAMKLTDSIAKVYNIKLKRTSLKTRNQDNVPSKNEEIALNTWKAEVENGGKIKPQIIHSNNGEIQFIAPIKLKSQCITCHGSNDFVTAEIKAKLKIHYPEDKATGYKEGDLRGAWSIIFPKGYFDNL